MATHPTHPQPGPSDDEPEVPNPTRLPVEPEFAPLVPQSVPEEPGVQAPKI